MASYETDYVWDVESEVSGRSMWSPSYLHKFTGLLRDNTVLLQRVQGYPRDDPIHELKRRALEEARVKLGLSNVEQVRARITTFRQFATGKFRTCAARFGPGTAPETILRRMPKWLRDLEPHLNLWKMREQKSEEGPGGRLARALAARARALRTLDARIVANRVGGVPINKQDELKFIWWRMLDVVRQKLSLLCAGGSQGAGAVRLTGAEPLLAELVLLYDESINTVPDADDTEGMQALVGLFHVAQQFRLEDEPTASTWRRAHTAYITEHHKVMGFRASRLLMQRRWFELKLASRRALLKYAREPLLPPCPLHASIAKRFPHVVTAPWRSWRDVVNSSAFVEAHEDWTSQDADTDSMPSCEYKPLEVAADDPERERERDGEDDLIVVEREIETIDLEIEGDTEHTTDDTLHDQLGSETHDIAAELEKDLERQLAQLHPTEPSEGELHPTEPSEGDLFNTEPNGPPTFIYDSDDDMDDDDREKNMALIATQICSEINDQMTCDDDDNNSGENNDGDQENGDGGENNDGDDASGDDEHGTIDEKLLMDARVQLRRVDDSARWRDAAECGTINIQQLLHTYPPCKRARTIHTDMTEMLDNKTETTPVVVKQEKIDDDTSIGRGERQVKSMARRLIAEMMRDTDSEPTKKHNGAKKVQLPDIEEIRKNNSTMLTAQVAPLSSPTPTLDKLTTDVVQSAPAQSEEVPLTKLQLDNLLEQLTHQRQTSNSTKYCCPAREQHLTPSATRRVAPSTCRSCSRAGGGGRCKCCCWYLLHVTRCGAHAHVQHKQTRTQLNLEQRALATDLYNLATTQTPSVFSDKAKKRPYKEKKGGVTPPAPPASDPLEEWIRQKNLNQQYFNLNLKTPKPTAPTKATTSTPPLSTAPTKTTTSTPPLTTAPTKTTFSTPLSTAPSNTTYAPPISIATVKTNDQTQPSTSKFLTIVPLSRPSTAPQMTEAPAPPPTHSNILSVASATALTKKLATAPPPTHSNILSIASATALTKKLAPAPPPEFRKFLLVPTNKSDPQAKTKVVFGNNNPNLKFLQSVGVKGVPPKIINFDSSMLNNKQSQGPLIYDVDDVTDDPSPSPSPVVLTTDKPKVHAKLITTQKNPKIVMKMSQKPKVHINKQTNQNAMKVVTAPSRTIPGNTLVRLSPAPSLLNSSLTPVSSAPPQLAPSPSPAPAPTPSPRYGALKWTPTTALFTKLGEVKLTPTTAPSTSTCSEVKLTSTTAPTTAPSTGPSFTTAGAVRPPHWPASVRLAPKPGPSQVDSGAVMASVRKYLRGTGMEVTKISAAGPGGAGHSGPGGSHTEPAGGPSRSEGGPARSLLKDTSTGGSKIDASTTAAINKQLAKISVDQKIISLSNDQRVINSSSDQQVINSSTQKMRDPSLIWLYFDRVSDTLAQCKLCKSQINHGGGITGNMYRHLKMIHHKTEDASSTAAINKKLAKISVDQKTISLSNDQRVINSSSDQQVINSNSSTQNMRPSWIWSYFDRVSDTLAQCKLCQRKINHGGNATGNMNRHLKMIHHKTEDGAVLTKITTGNKTTSEVAHADTGNSSPDIKIENYFKHDHRTITISRFLSRLGSMLAFQVVEENVPPLMIGARSHLVTERPLHARKPAFWTITPPLCRLVADSYVLFPPLELVDNKHQLLLQDNPRIYAKVYWVIHAISQCVSVLSSGARLFVTSREGLLTPLTRDTHGLIKCPNLQAVKVLSDLLSASNSKADTKADSNSRADTKADSNSKADCKADSNSRADINARASALLALNHSRRRPLELVHVSDDESEEQKHDPKQTLHNDKFNGLERFEDMDDFDL